MEQFIIDKVVELTNEKNKIESYLAFIRDTSCGGVKLGWGREPYNIGDGYGTFLMKENNQMKDILKRHHEAIIHELVKNIKDIELQLSKL